MAYKVTHLDGVEEEIDADLYKHTERFTVFLRIRGTGNQPHQVASLLTDRIRRVDKVD